MAKLRTMVYKKHELDRFIAVAPFTFDDGRKTHTFCIEHGLWIPIFTVGYSEERVPSFSIPLTFGTVEEAKDWVDNLTDRHRIDQHGGYATPLDYEIITIRDYISNESKLMCKLKDIEFRDFIEMGEIPRFNSTGEVIPD